jgi:glycosyltransferase involved in cell wall biosynthesis
MKQLMSVIIPNYNGSQTIGTCLESVFAINDEDREVIVVDDCSEDGSLDIIRKYPCRLIQMEKHAGASAARNAGALNSKGDVLFFIDADCLLQENASSIIRKYLHEHSAEVVMGGTYTPTPPVSGFFNTFQSAFIHHFETKSNDAPDYLATHALVIRVETFKKMGGFREDFLPILEDVDFSHRLRSTGYRLIMNPDLQVQHVFNLSLLRSLQNAVRKTRYWIEYSLTRKDLFADSGTASREIKINGVVWLANAILALVFLLSGQRGLLVPVPLLWGAGMYVNRHLFRTFVRAGGTVFAVMAAAYYTALYPAALWAGVIRGLVQYMTGTARHDDFGGIARAKSSVPAKD